MKWKESWDQTLSLRSTLILLGEHSRKYHVRKIFNEYYCDPSLFLDLDFLFLLEVKGHLGQKFGITQAEKVNPGLRPEWTWAGIADQEMNHINHSGVSHFVRSVRDWDMSREELKRKKAAVSEWCINAQVCSGEIWPMLVSLEALRIKDGCHLRQRRASLSKWPEAGASDWLTTEVPEWWRRGQGKAYSPRANVGSCHHNQKQWEFRAFISMPTCWTRLLPDQQWACPGWETQVLESLGCPLPSKTVSAIEVRLGVFSVLFFYFELHQEGRSIQASPPRPKELQD